MAATILSKSGVTLLFAIDAGIQAISGYVVQDDSQEQNCKTTDATDAVGSTLAVAFFDQMSDIKFKALLLSATTLPVPGAIVEVNSINYAVMPPVVKNEVNNRFTEATISLRAWLDNVVPVAP